MNSPRDSKKSETPKRQAMSDLLDLDLPKSAQDDTLPDVPFDPDLNYEHSLVLKEMYPYRKELPRNPEPFVYRKHLKGYRRLINLYRF